LAKISPVFPEITGLEGGVKIKKYNYQRKQRPTIQADRTGGL